MNGSPAEGSVSGSPPQARIGPANKIFGFVADTVSPVVRLFAAKPRFTLAAIGLFSIALACLLAVSRRPWVDESWFASASYNLFRGKPMAITVLDPHGFPFAPFVEGVNQLTYWVMPLYLILLAGWYKIVGFGLFPMRSVSLIWELVALGCWYYLLRWLTASSPLALLATFLVTVEHTFAMSGVTARMDMMCAALNLASVAIYVRLRARFELAIFASACVLAVSLFTHPNALFGGLFILLVVLWFDRDKISVRSILLASIPFAIGAGLWGIYLSRSPGTFWAQMAAQQKLPHRFDLSWNLYNSLRDEINIRYSSAYRLHDKLPLGFAGLLFYIYLGATAAVLFIPSLRRTQGGKFLLLLTIVSVFVLSRLQKNTYYLLFVTPFLTAMIALLLSWLWRRGNGAKTLAVSIFITFLGLQFLLIGARVLRNDYRLQYLPVTEYLKSHVKPGEMIMGSGELGFELGFDGQVVDDTRLGFGSGKVPEYIVLEHQYKTFWFRTFFFTEPAVYRYVRYILSTEYSVVFDTGGSRYAGRFFTDAPYEVLKRRTPAEIAVAREEQAKREEEKRISASGASE